MNSNKQDFDPSTVVTTNDADEKSTTNRDTGTRSQSLGVPSRDNSRDVFSVNKGKFQVHFSRKVSKAAALFSCGIFYTPAAPNPPLPKHNNY